MPSGVIGEIVWKGAGSSYHGGFMDHERNSSYPTHILCSARYSIILTSPLSPPSEMYRSCGLVRS
ncbi:hypothetical protein F442_11802 [Phytophthora nicotianae P10297]|uniref:Uncharacterized protein n=1 Tax=Phytophthora nicotianae P10297 TaxID=1317064 RepID=W2Z1K0_PHYNI|nr:hypothetical protein F442_11802 [Phytophthora nicotianae P10297]